MIAHRGGYDWDSGGENTIENILFSCIHCPDVDIEIDVFWYQNRFIVCHDPPQKNNVHPTLLDDRTSRSPTVYEPPIS